MPEEKLPLDEQFIHKFYTAWRKISFMLSVKNEIQQHFEDILVEHDYFETDVFCN
jgi:hypothetical protein